MDEFENHGDYKTIQEVRVSITPLLQIDEENLLLRIEEEKKEKELLHY